jgi:hypothetical protein
VRTAYLEGRSIAALARDHDVSRGAIRTAVADLLPEYTAVDPGTPAPELAVALDMPSKVADFLRAAGPASAIARRTRTASCRTVRFAASGNTSPSTRRATPALTPTTPSQIALALAASMRPRIKAVPVSGTTRSNPIARPSRTLAAVPDNLNAADTSSASARDISTDQAPPHRSASRCRRRSNSTIAANSTASAHDDNRRAARINSTRPCSSSPAGQNPATAAAKPGPGSNPANTSTATGTAEHLPRPTEPANTISSSNILARQYKDQKNIRTPKAMGIAISQAHDLRRKAA